MPREASNVSLDLRILSGMEAELSSTLTCYSRLKTEIREWNLATFKNGGEHPSNESVSPEAKLFYSQCELLQSQLSLSLTFAFASGLALGKALESQLRDTLLELKVLLAFPPQALAEATMRIRAGRWKPLADVQHELGHKDR